MKQDYAQILNEAFTAARGAVVGISDIGTCGMAAVRFPGNTSFGRYCRKNGIGIPMSGGRSIPNPGGYRGQNIDGHEKGAYAFAGVLKSHGIDCYAEYWVD